MRPWTQHCACTLHTTLPFHIFLTRCTFCTISMEPKNLSFSSATFSRYPGGGSRRSRFQKNSLIPGSPHRLACGLASCLSFPRQDRGAGELSQGLLKAVVSAPAIATSRPTGCGDVSTALPQWKKTPSFLFTDSRGEASGESQTTAALHRLTSQDLLFSWPAFPLRIKNSRNS